MKMTNATIEMYPKLAHFIQHDLRKRTLEAKIVVDAIEKQEI